MNQSKKHIRRVLICFCVLFAILCGYLIYMINAYGSRWFTTPYNSRISMQKRSVIAGSILDRNEQLLASSDAEGERIYSEDPIIRAATAHMVGDNYGQTFGAETFFAKYLLGFDRGLLAQVSETVSGVRQKGSDIRLTLDAELSESLYKAMGDHSGAAVIMNYKTGEILASVSRPGFDPAYMQEYLSGTLQMPESGMVNRVTMGRYPPGSTFKIVTLIAALRYLPGITDRVFSCDGPLVFDVKNGKYLPEVKISPEEDLALRKEDKGLEESKEQYKNYALLRDYQSEYHGELNLKQAFEKSCNHVFAQLAMEVGASRMMKVAKELGFNTDFLFEDLVVYASSYERSKTEYELAWSGVGQSRDLATPIHICMLTAAAANEGQMMEPRLLLGVTTPQGKETEPLSAKPYPVKLNAYECEILREYMLGVVKNGTGKRVRLKGLEVGGKTGTAETSSDKTIKAHAWFAGFVYSDAHPIAITVILEEGGSGGSAAGPVALQGMEEAIRLGY